MMKLKIGLALGLLLGVAAGGVAMLTPRAPLEPIPQAARSAEPSKAKDKPAVRVDRYGDPLPPGAIARLGTLRFRIEASGYVRELAISPDGKTIAAASIGGLCLFDAASGKRTKWLHPPATSFWLVAFSPDGKRLLAAAQDLRPIRLKNGFTMKNGVQVWDVASGQMSTAVELENMLRLGWTAGGQPLAACQNKDAIELHEIAVGRKQRFSAKDLSGPISTHCAVGKTVLAATGNQSGIIHIWDIKSGEERWTFETGGVFSTSPSLIFSADERWLASLTRGAADKFVLQLWDLATGKAKRIVTADQQHLSAATFTTDGKTLASIGQQEVRFWDTVSGRQRGSLKGEGQSFNTRAFSFAPDGKTLATMESLCGAIHLWDVATGERKSGPEGHSTNWVQTASFSPDGKRLATSGGLDGTIRVWDAADGRQLMLLHRPDPNYAAACAFSSDGRTVYSCWNDGLLLSDAATGHELHVLKCANMKMFLSSDFRKAIALRCASGGGYGGGAPGGGAKNDGWIGGWDITTRNQLFRRRLAYRGSERNLTISADARVLAVPSGKREPMHLEDVETGEQLLTFPVVKGNTCPLAFSPDGRLLLSHTSTSTPSAPGGFERTLRLWEVLTASELSALPASINLSAEAAFSPDGRLLAMIPPHEDVLPSRQEILLWDLKMGKALHRFKGYGSSVTSLSFSPDSRRLVSGLYNSSLLVWNVPLPKLSDTEKPGPEGATKAWADLAGADALRAFRARWKLASAGEQAIPLLRKHLHPAKAADPQRLHRLLADLDGEQFAVREKAQGELEKLDDLAVPALRKTLANKPSLEMRRRVEAVLERSRGPVKQPELLQALRAVAVLEDIGTPEARRLLEEMVKGAAESRLTREAKASLRRLDLRKSSPSRDR